MLLVAVALAIIGQDFLDARTHIAAALALCMAVIALVALVFVGQESPVRHAAKAAWLEWLLVALIVGLAVALRLYRLDAMPPGLHPDEATNGLEAARIAETNEHHLWSDALSGRPTLHLEVVAGFFKVFGVEPFTLHLVSVAAGAATVLALYLFAREAFGSRVAVLAAFLLAVNRWHIHYSRMGWEVILAPLAAITAAFFLLRGIRTGSVWCYAASGAALSLGIYSYISFRLIPPVFLAVILLVVLRGRLSYLRKHWNGLAAFALAFLAVFAPLGKWAWENQERFSNRFREVSVFDVDEPLETLGENIGRELAMFNFKGPPFALQNLPDEPMLATPFAILFVLGIGLVFARLARPAYALVALFMAAGIAAAVLVVPEETPHAHRAIIAAPMVALVAGLFLAESSAVLERVLRGRARATVWALTFSILAFVAALEAHTYFNKQAHDPRVWGAFSGDAMQLARHVERTADDQAVYVAPGFYRSPAAAVDLDFVAYEARGKYRPFDYVEDIPARLAAGDVSYVLHQQQQVLLPLFRTVYPNGIFEERLNPFGELMFMTYEVSSAEIQATRGLEARYYNNADWAGQPTVVRREAALDSSQNPPPLATPYSAEWTGTVYVPRPGPYRMRIDGDGLGSVVLDGEAFPDQGRYLEKGLHPIRVRYRPEGNRGPALIWETEGMPQTVPSQVLFSFDAGPNGLRASYWENDEFDGEPSVIQIDRAVFANNVIAGPFSVEWTGWLWVKQPGDYTLATLSDDGSFLYLDGALVVDNGGKHGAKRVEARANLTRGFHEIRLLYFETFGGFLMDLRWTPPGGQDTPIPVEALFYRLPAAAPDSVVVEAGAAAAWTGARVATEPLAAHETASDGQ